MDRMPLQLGVSLNTVLTIGLVFLHNVCWSFIPSLQRPSLLNVQTQRRTQRGLGLGKRVPIFPLRKERSPDQPISLNLFEDRYLAMVDYILEQDWQQRGRDGPSLLFGVVECGIKPLMVKGGVGPIVPIICRGDDGWLCEMTHTNDTMTDTRGGDKRRCMRLVAERRERFVVDEVLNNGFDEDSFIFARVTVLE